MIFPRKYHLLIQRILLVSLAIVVFEFSFPYHLEARVAEDSLVTGPVLVQLKTDDENKNIIVIDQPPQRIQWVTVTAYSSTLDQCDNTPFITANGKWVYDGLIAANFLRFGTAVKFPDYFGDKVFTVNDRMNSKYSSRIDVWMPTREAAKEFGVRYLKVEIY